MRELPPTLAESGIEECEQIPISLFRERHVCSVPPTYFPTVSSQFIADWLLALRSLCAQDHYLSRLDRAGLLTGQNTS